jgi:uncharacterized membrane protein
VSDLKADTGTLSGGRLGLLLACFDGRKTAGKARRSLEAQVRAQGDQRLDTVVVEVGEKHKASTHDPRRDLWGTLTAAFVWGLCGALGGNGVASIVLWAVVGAVGGAFFYYYFIRHLTKSELARIGTGLPAESSALAMWVGTKDARRVLEASATQKPSVASVAAIGADLTTQVFTGPTDPVDLPHASSNAMDDKTVLNMVMLRYPKPATAKQMASHPPAEEGAGLSLEVEMVIRSDADGHRHVSDPDLGVWARAKSTLRSWGGFGLVFGAVIGAVGSGGVLGIIGDGLLTAVVWGVFGLAAGALYGLMAGAAFSPRGLKSVGSLVGPGTSILMAWVGKPITRSALDAFMTPGAQRLVLNVDVRESGAVLKAT